MVLGPLTFNEIFRPAPWGGHALARLAAKRLPPGALIGESLEISDRSVVAGGPLAGRTLQQLVDAEPVALMGRRLKRFPLLIKLLDMAGGVSVQVHPDDRCAREMKLQDAGKTEAWYILRAGPPGCVVTGIKSAGDVPRLRELAASGEIADRLTCGSPKAGELWFCPAGTVHGAGPGVVALEVQQNSNATFRIYDWRRPGLDGKLRELHLEESRRAIDPASKLRRQRARQLRGMPFPASRLVACDKFTMDSWAVSRRVAMEKAGRFEILHVLSGSGRLSDGRWPPARLSKGRTVLLPACVREYELQPSRPLRLVRIAEGENH